MGVGRGRRKEGVIAEYVIADGEGVGGGRSHYKGEEEVSLHHSNGIE